MKRAPSTDIALSRELLRLALEEVRALFPAVKVSDAWVWHAGRDHWEFHFGAYYWNGRASNAYDARAKGWSAYIAKAADEVAKKADAQTIAAFKKELGK